MGADGERPREKRRGEQREGETETETQRERQRQRQRETEGEKSVHAAAPPRVSAPRPAGGPQAAAYSYTGVYGSPAGPARPAGGGAESPRVVPDSSLSLPSARRRRR